jgi:peptide/nickel transport system ATP-binding protein
VRVPLQSLATPPNKPAVDAPETAPVLSVQDLRVEFATRRGPAVAVDGVSLEIARGEVLGLVGESGCGKSVTALSVLRLIGHPGRIVGGRIELSGQDVLALSEREMRRIRGNRVSMIFQDPASTLNPVFRIGDQITEGLEHHGVYRGEAARERAAELLELVGIPSPRKRLRQYPHQLSGGMQQRVVIAIALALRPELLLADEPTTALDVTIQAEILDLLERLQEETGTGSLMITHDIGVVAKTCDRVAVMYAGRIVEDGSVSDVLEQPAHPYTIGLIGAVPRLERRNGERLHPIAGGIPDLVHLPSGCRFHPRCPYAMEICGRLEPELREWRAGHRVACHLYEETSAKTGVPIPAPTQLSAPALGRHPPSIERRADAHSTPVSEEAFAAERSQTAFARSSDPSAPLLRAEGLVKDFPSGWQWERGLPRQRFLRAVDNVSFEIRPGEALGLVGESGCGKSTTARLVMRLYEPTAGHVYLEGVDLTALAPAQLFERRRLFQMVFQNPYSSLDPRWTVERLISEPLDVHEALSRAERKDRVLGLVSSVSLGQLHLARYPHQLSGGQRQRVAIARALALNARLLVADEPVSSLDVSIQAQILELLSALKEELGLSLLFISHNLAVVNYLCEQVAVMYAGEIIEQGPTGDVLSSPRHPYTQVLLSSVLAPSIRSTRERIVAAGEPPSLSRRATNCPFHTRCPHAREVCRTETPPEVAVGDGHTARCHLIASGDL